MVLVQMGLVQMGLVKKGLVKMVLVMMFLVKNHDECYFQPIFPLILHY